jgi:hypothetical protein
MNYNAIVTSVTEGTIKMLAFCHAYMHVGIYIQMPHLHNRILGLVMKKPCLLKFVMVYGDVNIC